MDLKEVKSHLDTLSRVVEYYDVEAPPQGQLEPAVDAIRSLVVLVRDARERLAALESQ